MNKFLLFITIITSQVAFTQSAFFNSGNVEIHKNGQIGFHVDLNNEGSFESKRGFAGFYNDDDTIYVYGKNKIAFYDMEVVVEKDLQLLTPIEVSNSVNFIRGKVITPRDDKNVVLRFKNEALHAGENDNDHVDGYSSVISEESFTFPIGDDNRLRTASVDNNNSSQEIKAAYFYENANFAKTLNKSFNTEAKDNSIVEVSKEEYWDIEGQVPVNVTLTWDEYSNVSSMTKSVNDLIVVGWSRIDNEWKNLGKVETTGDLYNGSVKSATVFPDDYEALTIAVKIKGAVISTLDSNATILKTNLFDMTRRLVRTFGSDEAINLSGLAKGVYIKDVYLSNGDRYSKKIMN